MIYERSLSRQQQAIQRYLENYAEPQSRAIPALSSNLDISHPPVYDHVLVIPVYDESLDCLNQILPADACATLVIVVVNAAEDSDRAALQRTQAYLQTLVSRLTTNQDGKDTASGPDLFTVQTGPITLLVVDCCTPGRWLPANQGVGLARKIGGDIALAYIAQGRVSSQWIQYTDADAKLPSHKPTYPKQDDIAVVLYPFQHQPCHEHILLYEISLRYYVTQLAQARSPYAFHTIGSLMCINAHHYVKVRGFPKRKAAEDFYMLNKLAKTGKVVQLNQPIVSLDSRLSHRVPFGTGAMMTRLAASEPFLFYHPSIFHHLADWLECIEQLWPPAFAVVNQAVVNQAVVNQAAVHWSAISWFAQSPWSDACWIPCLLEMGVEKTVNRAYQQSRDRQHFQFYLWTWFDAFRTLKFVHYLRDHHYSSIDYQTLKRILKIGEKNSKAGSTEEELKLINQHFVSMEQALPTTRGPILALGATIRKTAKP